MYPPIRIPDHHPRWAARPLACAARARAVFVSVGLALSARPCGLGRCAASLLRSCRSALLGLRSRRPAAPCGARLRLCSACLFWSSWGRRSASARALRCGLAAPSFLLSLRAPYRSSRGLRGRFASPSLPRPCSLRLAVRSPSVSLPRLLGPLRASSVALLPAGPAPCLAPRVPTHRSALGGLSGSFACRGYIVFVRLRRGGSFVALLAVMSVVASSRISVGYSGRVGCPSVCIHVPSLRDCSPAAAHPLHDFDTLRSSKLCSGSVVVSKFTCVYPQTSASPTACCRFHPR